MTDFIKKALDSFNKEFPAQNDGSGNMHEVGCGGEYGDNECDCIFGEFKAFLLRCLEEQKEHIISSLPKKKELDEDGTTMIKLSDYTHGKIVAHNKLLDQVYKILK